MLGRCPVIENGSNVPTWPKLLPETLSNNQKSESHVFSVKQFMSRIEASINMLVLLKGVLVLKN